MIFVCKSHGVRIIIDGNLRRIEPPPGSWGNPCKIMIIHPVTEGKFGDCEIVKEK